MSKMVATLSGFVGFNGQSVWVGEGDEYDSSDPLVKALPQHFRSKPAPAAAKTEKQRTPRG